MGRPLSVADTKEMNELNKWDFYSAITGKDFWKSNSGGPGIGVTDEWDIRPEDKKLVYQAVLKFEKSSADIFYFRQEIGDIHDSYKSGNFKEFKDSIGQLLAAIVMD